MVDHPNHYGGEKNPYEAIKVIEAWENDGMKGWNRWKLHIYIPGKNIKRSLNLDGRGSDYKYEKEQVW